MNTNLFFKPWLALFFLISSCSVQSQSSIQLEPLGEVVIPFNYSFKNTPVGGLSGLTYDPATETFYVISDDRSELADARFYSFQVKLNDDDWLGEKSIRLQEVSFLKTPTGAHYKLNTIDPEGIAATPDSLIYVTSEGGRANEAPPFINAYERDGTFVKSLIMPGAYWAAKKEDRTTHGIRTNLAFESLALTPDGKTLYAATENALMQDGPIADTATTSPSRIIAYDVASGTVLHEYRYDVDKVYTSSGKRGPFSVNGLSDLMALDNEGHLLALDRNYVQEQGNHILLYKVDTEGATDLKGINNMEQHNQSIKPVKKTLVADLSDYGITLDNFEGLVMGPELAGGGRLLLIVSDNNFSDAQQTLFAAFRISIK